MSILRAPKAPDDKCDIGRHTFSYALQPHTGSFLESNIVQNGHEFNCPILPVIGSLKSEFGSIESFIKCDKSNLVIDTIKMAQSGKDLIIRFYESYGGRGIANISLSISILGCWESNVLEEKQDDISLNAQKNGFALDFTPFKLITIRIEL